MNKQQIINFFLPHVVHVDWLLCHIWWLCKLHQLVQVMWSETIALRTRTVWDQKIGLVLQVWCCETYGLVTLVVV